MNQAPGRESMNLGHAARKAGRAGEALGHFRAALAKEPDNAEANSAFGLMLLTLGRADESEAPLRQALEIEPANSTYRMNFAELLALQGKLDQAVQMVAEITAEDPQAWWAWDRLGELQVRLGNFGEAAANFGRAAALRPDDPALQFRWARASFDGGRVDEAERILRAAAKLEPDHEAIFQLGCEIFEAQSAWGQLERLATTWTQSHPRTPGAWRALAKAQWETGHLQQAIRNFRTSLELGARDAAGLAAFGSLCLAALDLDGATKAMDEAEKLDPNNSQMLSAQARRLMLCGRYEEAQSYCRRSLQLNRNDVLAYRALVEMLDGRLAPEDFEALETLAGREDIRIQDQITAAYSLADCLDARADIERAFSTYARANHLSASRAEAEDFRYDASARTGQIDELISMFSTAPPGAKGDSGPVPVFIVGMPRSGSTLIESVIGAHSQAFACGERAAARWIMQEFLASARSMGPAGIPESTWSRWRELYWTEMPDRRGATVVTDRNPWNFDAIGLILRLFPHARIIHVRRNPVETGFSIYRNEFRPFLPFTNRLEDIGHYYGEYARLMTHWQRVMGDRFTTVQYEDFVGAFDVAGPALLAACGLEWEETCRNPRRPPMKQASRAQSYATHLTPLTAQLEAAGVDLENGGTVLADS
ncbi:MAG: sulfotransferase [Steroidobacteraceae bacterium]